MTIPRSENDADIPSVEDRQLKVGYFRMLTERWPFGHVGESHNPENALFFTYEMEYMQIPKELEYPALEPSIDPAHHPRLRRLWDTLRRVERQWRVITSALINKWKDIPSASDPARYEEAQHIVDETRIAIAERFREAAAAIITVEFQGDSFSDEKLSPLQIWQLEEESLRRDLYFADKDFLLVLRTYYEMLLERYDKRFVLPQNHPSRGEIVLRNRYLRLIDAAHQGVSIEKALHHEQDARGKRIRKTRQIPYAMHPLSVLSAGIFDVIPYTIEQERLSFDPAIIGLLYPMHDTYEDTQYDLSGITQVLKSRADRVDTAVFPVFENAASEPREEVKRKVIDLMKDNVRKHIIQALRVLSKNTVFSDAERRKAAKQNIAGRERTAALLSLGSMELKRWRLNPTSHPQSKTFQRFPEPVLAKFDTFLIRLCALTSGTRQQHALIAKLEDAANNNASLNGMPVNYQQQVLRATVTRFIAWCVLDHDNARLPLFNALPRLIEVTLREYKRLASDFPDLMDALDFQYMRQLSAWQIEVGRLEVSARVRTVLEEYETARQTGASPAPEAH